jgi:hypothetical protein
MNWIIPTLAAAGLIISTTLAFATDHPGNSGEAPGHEMQEHGSVPGSPGASGYAPGHEMKEHEGAENEGAENKKHENEGAENEEYEHNGVHPKHDESDE